ncbi:MAG: hypothetical protein E7223_00580 [Clostridiales bacterium]|nr:hypothetical protein [Clostridiales bacterium]
MKANTIYKQELKLKGFLTYAALEPYMDGREFRTESIELREDGSCRIVVSLEDDRIGLADSGEEKTFHRFLLEGTFVPMDDDGNPLYGKPFSL